jgi:hypothetical protein
MRLTLIGWNVNPRVLWNKRLHYPNYENNIKGRQLTWEENHFIVFAANVSSPKNKRWKSKQIQLILDYRLLRIYWNDQKYCLIFVRHREFRKLLANQSIGILFYSLYALHFNPICDYCESKELNSHIASKRLFRRDLNIVWK